MTGKRLLQFLTTSSFAAVFIALAFGGARVKADSGFSGGVAVQQEAANPCAKAKAQNPCNPCAKKAQNPCNPGGQMGSGPVYEPAVSHAAWKKVNRKPLLSEAHGGKLVITYINEVAQKTVKAKSSTFPVGAILVKESYADVNGKPGEKGTVFAMEKTGEGWMWITTDPAGHITMKGDSEHMQMCASCHSGAKLDSAFLRSK